MKMSLIGMKMMLLENVRTPTTQVFAHRYAFSVPYLLDTVKQDGRISLMPVLMLTAARSHVR